MSVADDLNAAADYVEEHGYCQYTETDVHSRICLIGAIDAATGGNHTRTQQAILALYHTPHPACRTKRQAVALLRQAARAVA